MAHALISSMIPLKGSHLVRHTHTHASPRSIGCNVGDTSAEFFDVFAPELGVNKRTMYMAQPEPRKCTVCDHGPQGVRGTSATLIQTS
jgi:hypothetical protein